MLWVSDVLSMISLVLDLFGYIIDLITCDDCIVLLFVGFRRDGSMFIDIFNFCVVIVNDFVS